MNPKVLEAQVLQVFDQDGNGLITVDELKQILEEGSMEEVLLGPKRSRMELLCFRDAQGPEPGQFCLGLSMALVFGSWRFGGGGGALEQGPSGFLDEWQWHGSNAVEVRPNSP